MKRCTCFLVWLSWSFFMRHFHTGYSLLPFCISDFHWLCSLFLWKNDLRLTPLLKVVNSRWHQEAQSHWRRRGPRTWVWQNKWWMFFKRSVTSYQSITFSSKYYWLIRWSTDYFLTELLSTTSHLSQETAHCPNPAANRNYFPPSLRPLLSGITSTDSRNKLNKRAWSPARSGQTEQQDVLRKIQATRNSSDPSLLRPVGKKRSAGNSLYRKEIWR